MNLMLGFIRHRRLTSKKMGSGDWFKTVIRLKKVKTSSSKKAKKSSLEKSNPSKLKKNLAKDSSKSTKGGLDAISKSLGMPIEDIAAIRIQTAYRAYRARKNLRRLKGTLRLQTLTQGPSVKRHATSTLGYLHSWSNVQAQIRARRIFMVAEGRTRKKRLENQRKLEAKLHDVEVEWSGGAETMEEVLSRIHEREEASVKRERAMAYAFSHQWRANSSEIYGLGKDELGKADWGWSWKERWIAARPWESRVPSQFVSPKKSSIRQSTSKDGKKNNSPSPKTPVSAKPPFPNGKSTAKPRRLSYPPIVKRAAQEGSVKEEGSVKKEEMVT